MCPAPRHRPVDRSSPGHAYPECAADSKPGVKSSASMALFGRRATAGVARREYFSKKGLTGSGGAPRSASTDGDAVVGGSVGYDLVSMASSPSLRGGGGKVSALFAFWVA